MKEQFSSVSPKGQITLPIAVRRLLGIKPKDKVAFIVEEQGVRIAPAHSRLAENFQIVPPLRQPLTWKEIETAAHDEHAQHAAKEGL